MERGIHTDDRPDGIRALTISNPRKRNALDGALLDQLVAALGRPREDGRRVRAILIRGAGNVFCSGYDVEALDRITGRSPLPDEKLQQALEALEAQEAPSVACVSGPASGAGCELACACDFRVGSARAAFHMPPARLGLIYTPEGIARVMALVGPGCARRMFLAAERLTATEALAAGLLDELSPDGKLEATAEALCATLASGAPLAIAGMKRAFRWLATPARSAQDREELERLRRAAFLSADAREGRAAFLEKRKPRFEGR